MGKKRSERMLRFFYYILIFIFILPGCAHQAMVETPAPPVPAVEKPAQPGFFPADKYEPKINNFEVIIDASSSMGAPVAGKVKISLAKEFIEKMIRILPELNFNASLRTIGHNPIVTLKQTLCLYEPGPYDKARFEAAVKGIKHTGGYSPMAAALRAVDSDIAAAHGDTALIIISDGTGPESLAASALKVLKGKYKTGLCIYPVLIGDDPSGVRQMNDLAWIGECGFAVNASDIDTDPAMANYVEKVFLSRTVFKDTDGDGVYNRLDQCPETPSGAVVDKRGCWVVEDIAYDFDKWRIRPEYYPVLDRMVNVFTANPKLKVEIQGYTDNVGTQAYNLALSEKRAGSVMNHLVEKGVARDRIYVVGYGAESPVADNATPDGRAKNRRVELKPVYLVPVGR
ncbi:MAG: OmpA family protein [Deltaproteobacteria bacterium]|nr:OmpA family protein [Deltaproteobacteria bacterium]